MEEQASMQQIAEQTGGQQYLNTNGLQEAIASAIENGSSYYTIGYVPAAHPLDGQFRKIQINLESSDFKLAIAMAITPTLPTSPPSTLPARQPDYRGHPARRAAHHADPVSGAHASRRRSAFKGTKIPAGRAENWASFKGPLQRMVTDLTIDPAHAPLRHPADGADSFQGGIHAGGLRCDGSASTILTADSNSI
jgi:hypothetical protein